MLNGENCSEFSADLCFVKLKKQTVFFLQTAEVWSTSSAADVCRCGPQTADVLPLKKQTAPKSCKMIYHRKSEFYLENI
ncbi:hypothetical protein Hanom_Chr06g00486711 [Helianthus anomalus]